MDDLLVIGSNGIVAGIDKRTGTIRWQTVLMPGFLGGGVSQDVSVLVHDCYVYAGCHGALFCLSLRSGQILWKNELKGFGYNDVSLALNNISVQYLEKVERERD